MDNLSDSAPAPSVPESYVRKTDWRAPSFSTSLAGRLSGCERQKEVVGPEKMSSRRAWTSEAKARVFFNSAARLKPCLPRPIQGSL